MNLRRRGFFAIALAAALLSVRSPAETPPVEAAKSTRPFRMGFTGFVPALTAEAFVGTRDFCRKHGDLIAHHLEGAAWTEMHAGEPLPAALLKKWNEHRERKPDEGKVYLALSPR